MKRFDVVVVGARWAGSPLATMLARRGLSVCLVDRAQFPSETPLRCYQLLLRVLNHEVRPSQLFTMSRVARAAVRRLLDRPGQVMATLKEIVTTGRQNVRRGRHRRMRPAGIGAPL